MLTQSSQKSHYTLLTYYNTFSFFSFRENGELSIRLYVRLSVTNSSNKTFFSAIVYITYTHNIWYPDGMFNFFSKWNKCKQSKYLIFLTQVWNEDWKYTCCDYNMPTHMWIGKKKKLTWLVNVVKRLHLIAKEWKGKKV